MKCPRCNSEMQKINNIYVCPKCGFQPKNENVDINKLKPMNDAQSSINNSNKSLNS